MWLYLGIFLSTLGLLFLEVFSVRIISIAVSDSSIFYVVSLAMFGLGTAGTIAALMKPVTDPARLATRARWLTLGAAVSILALFVGLDVFTAAGGKALDAALLREPPSAEGVMPAAYIAAYMRQVTLGAAVVGALMFLPYLLFGLTLALLFRGADGASMARMYTVDLTGACVGAVLAILALDSWEFATAALFAAAMPVLAAVAFGLAAGRKPLEGVAVAAVAGAVVLGLPAAGVRIEPEPHVGSMARTQHVYIGYEPREIWHTWSSFGRIAALELHDPRDGLTRTIMAQGSGEGHARVLPPGDGFDERLVVPNSLWPAVRLTLAGCDSGRALVLLAGAGADMVLMDRLAGGRLDITGVEIAPEMFEWPASQERYGLGAFFARPNIHMNGAEGREFLARDGTRYDCILRSFAGASRGFLAGVSTSAPTPLLTREGLREILGHLEPDGQVTLLRMRISDILTIREVLREQGRSDVSDVFIVASTQRPRTDADYILANGRDLFVVLVKPSGFTAAEAARIGTIVADSDLNLLYDPYQPPEAATLVHRLVNGSDPYRVANDVLGPLGARLYPVTDDQPFADDEFPLTAYLTADFWLGRDNPEFSPRTNNIWKSKRRHMLFVSALTIGSVVLILAPLLLSYRHNPIPAGRGTANHLAYFGALGAGFMFVEMGLIQKLQLLVGHPGYTIAIVLASLILFTGVGSFLSDRIFRSGILGFRGAALLAAGTAALTVLMLDAWTAELVGLPRTTKLLVAFLVPVLPGIFMGQLFPQGLASLTSSQRLIPLSMGINAMTSTIASGLGVALAQVIGFRAIILIGCVIYVGVALLPHRQREVALAGQPETA